MVPSIEFRLQVFKNAITAMLLSFCFFSCTTASYAAAGVYLRVLVFKEAKSVNLEIKGAYEVLDKKTDGILSDGTDLNTTLKEQNRRLMLGGGDLVTDSLVIRARESNVVMIDGREFRGDIQFIRNKAGRGFSVINYLELEEYVKGVLYHEVSHFWPMEALKAQAIASRTFALYQQRMNRDRDYDLTADIYSQVYGGKTSERYRTNLAVGETQGRILIYQNKILPAYYSATCAGHTEDASRLWDVNIEPLKGVVCGFCADSPHIKWQRAVALRDISEALSKIGFVIGPDIKAITVISRDNSGRIDQMQILSNSDKVDISGKDFRNAVGPNIIRSADFEVRLSKKQAYFTGRGWGHGAGLCQWGAYFMAKHGLRFDKILEHYYPGSRIGLIEETEY